LQTGSKLPIQRARMRVRISMPTADGKRLKEQVVGGADTVEEDAMGEEEWVAVRIVIALSTEV
jgi:ribosome maturation protein SDO1